MKNNFKIEGSLNLIPMVGGLLIFTSLVYNLGYYSVFKINITSYLGLSEVLTLFFEDIIPISFIIALLVSFTSFPPKIFSKPGNKKSQESPLSYLHIVRSIPGFLLLSMSAVLYIYNEHYYHRHYRSFDTRFLPLIYLVLFGSFLWGLRLIWKNIEDAFLSSLTSYIWIIALLFGLFYCMGIYKGTFILEGNVNVANYYSITLKDSSIIMIDASKVYLGKTNSSYFYYDFKDKTSHIIAADRVSEIISFSRR